MLMLIAISSLGVSVGFGLWLKRRSDYWLRIWGYGTLIAFWAFFLAFLAMGATPVEALLVALLAPFVSLAGLSPQFITARMAERRIKAPKNKSG